MSSLQVSASLSAILLKAAEELGQRPNDYNERYKKHTSCLAKLEILVPGLTGVLNELEAASNAEPNSGGFAYGVGPCIDQLTNNPSEQGYKIRTTIPNFEIIIFPPTDERDRPDFYVWNQELRLRTSVSPDGAITSLLANVIKLGQLNENALEKLAPRRALGRLIGFPPEIRAAAP